MKRRTFLGYAALATLPFAAGARAAPPIKALLPRDPSGHQFLLYSDSTSGQPGLPHEARHRQVTAMIQRIRPEPEFIAFPGDAVMQGGDDAQWRHWTDVEMKWFKGKRYPLYQSTSNHNTYDRQSEDLFRAYNPRLPRNGPAGQEGLAYFVRTGNLLYVSMHQPLRWQEDGMPIPGLPSFADTAWLDQVLSHAETNWSSPGFQQTDREPVVCVSWDDAQAYIGWLNDQVREAGRVSKGQPGPYRLPSTTEWLYAARGGAQTLTPYYWGYEPNHDYANFGLDQCWPCGVVPKAGPSGSYLYTTPVGLFPPSAFGLYDMVGNVWQFVQDCFYDDVAEIPKDGSVLTKKDCKKHGVYGASYDDEFHSLYISLMPGNYFPSGVRNYANGFRVVRTLD